MPPMYIRNDRQVQAFMKKLAEFRGGIQLCVTVEKGKTSTNPMMGTSNISISSESNTDPYSTYQVMNEVQMYSANPAPITFVSAPACHVMNEMRFDSTIPERVRTETESFSNISEGSAPVGGSTISASSNTLYCGKLFKDKKEMGRQMQLFAMENNFEFRTKKSDSTRYTLRCIDEKCSWRLRATRVKASDSFIIKKYVSEHCCDSSLRKVNHRQATARTLGEMVSNHFRGEKLALKPKQLIEKFRHDNGIGVSYSKARRAKDHAIDVARGTPEDGYEFLPMWMYMVNEKNPGSATFIEVDPDNKFKYAFLAFVMKDAAYAYTRFDFEQLFHELSLADNKMAQYLWDLDVKKWSRACAPANRYNIMTSNLAESLNSLLKESREYPIVCLFDTIRSTLTRWFNERHEKGTRNRHSVTVNVMKQVKTLYDSTARWLEVSQVNQHVFEVKGGTLVHVVNLETRDCTCCVFNITKIPCAHAIAAAKHINLNEYDYVDTLYSNKRYVIF
ncbi:unnamed protein product [Arabidopsis arenosa]|uniref:SWIM-type domain-containing protein n=1 Tax=Arabidopsis arenosa TaxID=38785 RepID=A0A8S1ZMG8_ARAAE|nr:unnamed protein product [Arabidopsis arenosa]